MGEQPVIILGAGLAGLSAAYHLRERGRASIIYEQDDRPGGHTRSHREAGFTFDEGPHVSFTKDRYVQALFAKSAGSYREFLATQLNYYRGTWLKHPALAHLHGLSAEVIERCLLDLIEAQRQRPRRAPTHYGEWLRQQCGHFFAENFAARYTRKYWTVEPEQLTTEWVGARVYAPKLEEVIRGALQPQPQALHYIQRCRYPSVGGYEAYTRLLQQDVEIRTGCRLVTLDVRRRRAVFANGQHVSYHTLISSMPLPTLIDTMSDAPSAVKAAAGRLRWTSVLLVNVGVRRRDLSAADWLYVYDEDIIFSRISFPHRLAPRNVPKGCGSVQAEIYYSRQKPLPRGNLLQRALRDLRRIGMLREDDELMVAHTRDISFANVLFTRDREASVTTIHRFLHARGIYPCGRYGEWGYLWSDQAVLSGRRVAEQMSQEAATPPASKRRVRQEV